MTRDSPPELARALAGPYASTMRTRRPARCKCQAVQAPKTPAPITATSYPPERRAGGGGSAATAASFIRSRRRITGWSRCARRAAETHWESRHAARRSPRVATSPVARGRAPLAGRAAGPLREHASSHEKRPRAGDGELYVGHGDGALGAIDPARMKVVAEIPLPGRPESFRL